jgi:hypothetical protein
MSKKSKNKKNKKTSSLVKDIAPNASEEPTEQQREVIVSKPLGPAILQTTAEQIIYDLNIITEQINDIGRAEEFLFPKHLDDSISQRLTCPLDIIKGMVPFFQTTVSAYLTYLSNNGIEVAEQWTVGFNYAYITRCNAGDFTASRRGYPGTLSCICILKTPDEEGGGSPASESSDKSGCIELSYGTPSAFYKEDMLITPKTGDFYMFPSSLAIRLYPFKSSGELRFFSACLSITEAGEKEDTVWPTLLQD